MKHILPTETVNKILQYLAGKAYSEVHHLIVEIQKLAVPFDSEEMVNKKPIETIPDSEQTK